jgi:hypothetical protein
MALITIPRAIILVVSKSIIAASLPIMIPSWNVLARRFSGGGGGSSGSGGSGGGKHPAQHVLGVILISNVSSTFSSWVCVEVSAEVSSMLIVALAKASLGVRRRRE